jgi:signal transduction histidine kinase
LRFIRFREVDDLDGGQRVAVFISGYRSGGYIQYRHNIVTHRFNTLLDNAIKNSPYGDEIKVIGCNVDKRLVEVRVVDNGAGIPLEQLQHLFERFYQSGGARSGYGLGLAIAREIVVAHGGTIDVKSEPGEGAEFIITLPVHPSTR